MRIKREVGEFGRRGGQRRRVTNQNVGVGEQRREQRTHTVAQLAEAQGAATRASGDSDTISSGAGIAIAAPRLGFERQVPLQQHALVLRERRRTTIAPRAGQPRNAGPLPRTYTHRRITRTDQRQRRGIYARPATRTSSPPETRISRSRARGVGVAECGHHLARRHRVHLDRKAKVRAGSRRRRRRRRAGIDARGSWPAPATIAESARAPRPPPRCARPSVRQGPRRQRHRQDRPLQPHEHRRIRHRRHPPRQLAERLRQVLRHQPRRPAPRVDRHRRHRTRQHALPTLTTNRHRHQSQFIRPELPRPRDRTQGPRGPGPTGFCQGQRRPLSSIANSQQLRGNRGPLHATRRFDHFSGTLRRARAHRAFASRRPAAR